MSSCLKFVCSWEREAVQLLYVVVQCQSEVEWTFGSGVDRPFSRGARLTRMVDLLWNCVIWYRARIALNLYFNLEFLTISFRGTSKLCRFVIFIWIIVTVRYMLMASPRRLALFRLSHPVFGFTRYAQSLCHPHPKCSNCPRHVQKER